MHAFEYRAWEKGAAMSHSCPSEYMYKACMVVITGNLLRFPLLVLDAAQAVNTVYNKRCSIIGLSPNITNDKVSLIKPAVQQNILHKYASQQTSLTATKSFSNSPSQQDIAQMMPYVNGSLQQKEVTQTGSTQNVLIG